MNAKEFDNEVVCRAVYAWVKGGGPEPYSPVVASLTSLVLDIVRADRVRNRLDEWTYNDECLTSEELGESVSRDRSALDASLKDIEGRVPGVTYLPNMDATAGAWVALAYVASLGVEELEPGTSYSNLLRMLQDLEDLVVHKMRETDR